MAKLNKQWLNLDPAAVGYLGSADIPHSSGVSTGQAIDALNTPGLCTESFTLTATNILEKRVRLSHTCASRENIVMGVCYGPTQRYGVDFIVSADSPNYVYWDGLAMQDHLVEGDQIHVTYEVENQILGTFAGTGGGDTPAPAGLPATVRVTDNYTVTKPVTLLVDTTEREVFVQLSPAATSKDFTVLVKILQGTHNAIIAPQGADLVDQHNEELAIEEVGASYSLVCDGQGWFLV